MGFYGADVDELDALADTCVAVAESLRMTRADVRRTVHSSPWDGDDAERFRVDFDRRVGPSLDEVASLLEAAASTIRTNADEQRAASTSTATGGAWGGVPGGFAGVGWLGFPWVGGFMGPVPAWLEALIDDGFTFVDGLGALDSAWSILKGTKASKLISYVDIFAASAEIAVTWSTYGIGDSRTWQAIGIGVPGVVMGAVYPPAGLAWDAATLGTDFLLESTGAGEAFGDAAFGRAYDGAFQELPEVDREWWRGASEGEKDAYLAQVNQQSSQASEMVERTRRPWLLVKDLVVGWDGGR